MIFQVQNIFISKNLGISEIKFRLKSSILAKNWLFAIYHHFLHYTKSNFVKSRLAENFLINDNK